MAPLQAGVLGRLQGVRTSVGRGAWWGSVCGNFPRVTRYIIFVRDPDFFDLSFRFNRLIYGDLAAARPGRRSRQQARWAAVCRIHIVAFYHFDSEGKFVVYITGVSTIQRQSQLLLLPVV